ncbi:disulfide bond formation protein B [Bradyrhizobium sp. Tv2a-2]|uniref:disulfide bond formation protein B n=1 Tax=Bradyrhizobium sp. Tv2a-2 TaxID=113395 RepID=UPI00046317AA|nr:disulfide bond formation protein B [Bradyrhizobium sp. Tv2a-2]
MPSQARSEANATLTAALLVLVVASATIAGAWFFQLVLDILPCPMCLEQRYAYYTIIPLSALVALGAATGAPRPLLIAGLIVIALIAAGNSVFGVYHAGVEWKFWQGPTDCTGPLVDFGKAGSLLDQLDKVKVIRCDEVQWRFLGISLAGYNALISALMAAIAGWGVVRSAKG